VVTDLGQNIIAHAINNAGQIVGASIASDGSEQAFLWQSNSGITNLTNLPAGISSTAISINNSGWVVGSSFDPNVGSSSFQGFLWRPSLGLMTVDGTGGWIAPQHINDQGAIAGEATMSADAQSTMGVVWSVSNGPTLVIAGVHVVANVQQINSQGQIVISEAVSGDLFFQNAGEEPITIGSAASALGINDSGVVVGSQLLSDGYAHAFLWKEQDGMQLIEGTVGFNSLATGINDVGQIVGYEDLADGSRIGFLYQDGTLTNLNNLVDASGIGWSGLTPLGINGDGQIVGDGLLNGVLTGFLLTPAASPTTVFVPESATAGVLLLGGMVLLRRRTSAKNFK